MPEKIKLCGHIEPLQNRLGKISTQFFFLLLLYTSCRIAFVLNNNKELELTNFSDYGSIFLYGFRFDLSAIAFTNIAYLLLVLVPIPFASNKIYLTICQLFFIAINAPCILLNLIDVAYFPFIHKRSQSDIFLFFTGEKGNDLYRLIPIFLRDYWTLFILLLLILWLLYRTSTLVLKLSEKRSGSYKTYLSSIFIYLTTISVAILLIRGGIQKKPLNIIHASAASSVRNMPAVLNTPFTIIKTSTKKSLRELNYMSADDLNPMHEGIHKQGNNSILLKKNIVIIIVESMSKNYLSYFGGPAKTPFLDSLFNQSLVFTNAFANGKQSIEGIPAILSSIPSWQDENFIFSPYAINKITSFANILSEEGYETSFFHGGFNGTMGFDAYCNLSGFGKYFGKDQYNKEGGESNEWGIWDEQFLEFTKEKISESKEPFFASLFTLNTHHPFNIPDKYKNIFNQPGHPILNCFSYLDHSLKRFFDLAKKETWFENTLFVITADHTGPKIDQIPESPLDDYRIPLVFYSGDKSLRGKSDIIANQIDILPSVLSLIEYPKPYFSFGISVFDSTANHYSIQYNQGIYQYSNNSYCLRFDGSNSIGIYSWKEDPQFKRNLINKLTAEERKSMEKNLKMNLQFFNACMLKNRMNVSSIK